MKNWLPRLQPSIACIRQPVQRQHHHSIQAATVRDHVARFLEPGSDILELNSSTGEDAAWFAAQGHRVHATDISIGMQEILEQKIAAPAGVGNTELISFTSLGQLRRKRIRSIFSRFCRTELHRSTGNVLQSFTVTETRRRGNASVLLPEMLFMGLLLVFRGRFKTAVSPLVCAEGRFGTGRRRCFPVLVLQSIIVTRQLKAHW